MLLIYILPIYRTISRIVMEKDSKMREFMKIMGLKDISFWLSWLTYYSIIVTIISLGCTLVMGFAITRFTNKFLMFLYFWLFGFSLFGYIVFIQAFFNRPSMAAIFGTLIYFGMGFLENVVQGKMLAT
jgi:ATP-binding cassette subfamily A (ABC1) protein 3